MHIPRHQDERIDDDFIAGIQGAHAVAMQPGKSSTKAE